jgi:hypothetical protein
LDLGASSKVSVFGIENVLPFAMHQANLFCANITAVCDQNSDFIYVPSWDGKYFVVSRSMGAGRT